MSVLITADQKEIWKQIPGWPSYEASTHGRIKRIKEVGIRKIKIMKAKDLIDLVELTKTKRFRKSYLILITFKGPPPTKYGCTKYDSMTRHLDDNRGNNNITNLAWGNHRNNASDKVRNGKSGIGKPLSKEHRIKISKAHKGKKLSEETKTLMSKNRLGVSLSKAIRNKISISNKGKVRTKLARRRLSVAHKSNKQSNETKLKISLGLKRAYQEERR